jgi:5'-3' exonuclease
VPDLLALVGDTADGIPGLRGFGDKTAAALLRRYEHIEAIPDSAEVWDVELRGKDRLAATLRESREEALLSRRLATLVTDVPIAERLDDLQWQGVPRQAFLAFSERLGTKELRVPRWR